MKKKPAKPEQQTTDMPEKSAGRKKSPAVPPHSRTPQKSTPPKSTPQKPKSPKSKSPKIPKLTAAQRVAFIQSLTDEERFTVSNAEDVAKFLGIGARQFQNYLAQGCPGRPSRAGQHDGILSLPEIVQWCKENVWKKAAKAPAGIPGGFDEYGDPMVPVPDGQSSPALERWRTARAEHAELDLAERKGTLVDIEKVQTAMIGMAQTLRLAGEQIARTHGNGPVEMLNEALTEIEQQIAEHFDRSDEEEDQPPQLEEDEDDRDD